MARTWATATSRTCPGVVVVGVVLVVVVVVIVVIVVVVVGMERRSMLVGDAAAVRVRCCSPRHPHDA
jgi:hypothetical protein